MEFFIYQIILSKNWVRKFYLPPQLFEWLPNIFKIITDKPILSPHRLVNYISCYMIYKSIEHTLPSDHKIQKTIYSSTAEECNCRGHIVESAIILLHSSPLTPRLSLPRQCYPLKTFL